MTENSGFRYNEYIPAEPLTKYIECFWEMSGKVAARKIMKETLVPGGRVELIFSPSSEFLWYGKNKQSKAKSFSGTFILGQRNTVSYIGLKGQFHFFGVRFRYGCLPLFIDLPANAWSNKITPLTEQSFDKTIPIIKLNNKINIHKLIPLVEKWLLKIEKVPKEDWLKLKEIIRQTSASDPESFSFKNSRENYGWNYKKTERVFAKYIGFPPRTFFKLVRFRHALENIKVKPDSLTSAAYRLGFYDQSHFIREFHNYTGDNPSSFFKTTAGSCKIVVQAYRLNISRLSNSYNLYIIFRLSFGIIRIKQPSSHVLS